MYVCMYVCREFSRDAPYSKTYPAVICTTKRGIAVPGAAYYEAQLKRIEIRLRRISVRSSALRFRRTTTLHQVIRETTDSVKHHSVP